MQKSFVNFVLIVTAILLTGCQQSRKELHLKDDEVAIIGYGSLTSIESMEETLGRKYDRFFDVVELEGYRRNWKVFMPNENDLYDPYFIIRNGDTVFPKNILYLNIDASPDSSLNGCIFVIKKTELSEFDTREWIYKRVDVTDNIKDLDIINGKAYAYSALDEFKAEGILEPDSFAVRQKYLDIIDSAFTHLDSEYKNRFFQTTQPYDEKLVIDDIILIK